MKNILSLPGCTPEPLINYLKALGVLRIVTEQADDSASGCWGDGEFKLTTRLSKETLTDFFLRKYQPTPIVVPWSGNDFFSIISSSNLAKFDKTPTGAEIIAAFSATGDKRLSAYRVAIKTCSAALLAAGVHKKDQMKGEAKALFLGKLRDIADQQLVGWIDSAAIIQDRKASFTAMLGSGGGSDGNTHFSDNFMQNLWDALPEFDSQRRRKKKSDSEISTAEVSSEWLNNVLYGDSTNKQVIGRTSSLFDSGAVGGPNAGQGFERSACVNPWNFILALEGAICFAGALSRRLGNHQRAVSAFPFQVQMASVGAGSVVDKEQAGREIWLPLWSRTAKLGEILQVLTEGRLQTGNRQAVDGTDALRAIATLGIDRGIAGFRRFAIVRGRVGGENYNTAASLGGVPVESHPAAMLLHEIDPWLNRFRSACGDTTPARFTSALRGIERAIFDFCRYGDDREKPGRFFQHILMALGKAEAAIASSPGFREKAKGLRPLVNLSKEWVTAANDNSAEFEIALALASLHDANGRIGSIRANLEPVVTGQYPEWAKKDRAVVWNATNLYINLAAILSRRLMDGQRTGSYSTKRSPSGYVGSIAALHEVPLPTISRFLAGELDETRITDLLWGLVLCEIPRDNPVSSVLDVGLPLPRAYGLLKLLFLSFPLRTEYGEIFVPPEPTIAALLRSGKTGEACRLAHRVLRGKGFMPLPHRPASGRNRDQEWGDTNPVDLDSIRLAAALLMPISFVSATKLQKLVFRTQDSEK